MINKNIYKPLIITSSIVFSSISFGQETLDICLDSDSAPYSYKQDGEGKGFDVDLANKISERMNKKLNIVWFEGENEKESSDALDANALLSKGKCDLVGGYAHFEGSLGAPSMIKAKLPDIDGEKRSKEWIKLGVLTPSRPYLNSPFTILTNEKSDISVNIEKLSELKGRKLAGLHGTLPHLLLMSNNNGYLADDINNLRWVDDIYGRLGKGNFEAILTELHKYDYYSHVNGSNGIKRTNYLHPISFNLGFITLQNKKEILTEINPLITNILESGEMEEIAQKNGMTFIKPTRPEILTRDSLMSRLTGG